LKYFIWDYDGTLFDTYPAITLTYQDLLKREYLIESNYNEILGWTNVSLNYCSENIANRFGLDLKEFRSKFNEFYSAGPLIEEPPFPGAKEICEYLRTIGCQNYIITHRDQRSLLRSLENYGMEQLFNDIVSRDHKFPKKPDPAAFRFLIEKHRLHPMETIGVGDREIDIQASRSAGIKACYINFDGLENSAADFNVKALLEIKEIIKTG
jgi:phosphoglycolate phosphatase-like HAD superfamily hydrolase